MALSRRQFFATAVAAAALTATGVTGAQAVTAEAPAGSYQPQMVEALADSLGVSESAAVARLDRQAALQKTLGLIQDKGVRTDGAFFDHKGRLVVNAANAQAAEDAEDAGLTARIPARGEAQLNRIKAALDARAAKRVPAGVTSWAVDVEKDTVTVTVADSKTASARSFLAAAAKYGSAVRVVKDKTEYEPQATVYPGSRMNLNNDSRSWCSVGFGARDSQGYQHLVSAGHCVESKPGLYLDGDRFAVGERSRFREGYNSVDMGTARVDSGDAIATSVGTWGNGSPVAVKGSQRATRGATVCKSGSTTGWTCGSVGSYNVSVTYTNPNTGARTYVTGLATSSVCTEGGDSGGAYISGNQGQGMTSGGPTGQQCNGVYGEGSSYFQPLDDALRYYGLTLNTN
ncbi:S1 family peptidase [Streptomyces sp. NA04227]|uniref:S1 family peptidase n=1 Tax=Streptomyces sp. NA04227 TaxID=2742136 RepID=UPI001591F6DE|nr:S1 family peptidase [Streptomyces sp. NA04227]QKW05004.1 S1 family peptidase [Streptomyces sp. NA04227]